MGAVAKPRPQERAAPAPTAPLPMAILLADDAIDLAEPIADMLRAVGHQVAVVNDGKSAMAMLDDHVYDLVISDVRLPGADGWSIFRRLRAEAPGTDVVLITA